jgi:hypothetical protein
MQVLGQRKCESYYGLIRKALSLIEDAYFLLEDYAGQSRVNRDKVKEAMEHLKKALIIVDEIASKELLKLLKSF